MSFRRQGAERHARGQEALADLVDGLNIVQWNSAVARFEVQKIAELNRFLVPQGLREGLVSGIAARVAGGLELVDKRAVERVAFAIPPYTVESADWKCDGIFAKGFVVDLDRLFLKTGKADTGDTAGHAGEVFRDEGAGEAQRFEVIAATIRRNDRNPHFGEDFQQTGLNGFLMAFHTLVQGEVAEKAFGVALCNTVLRQVSVDTGCAHTDQNCKIVRVQTFSRANRDGAEGAQALIDEVCLYGASREDHRAGNIVRTLIFVCENDVFMAGANRVFGFLLNAVEAGAQGFTGVRGRFWRRVGTVDHADAVAQHVHEALVHAIGQNRAFQHEDVGLGCV